MFGTLVGGVLLDKLGSTIANALALCALSTAAGCILIVADFVLARGFALFAVALAAGQFAMFMTQVGLGAGDGRRQCQVLWCGGRDDVYVHVLGV